MKNKLVDITKAAARLCVLAITCVTLLREALDNFTLFRVTQFKGSCDGVQRLFLTRWLSLEPPRGV